MRPETKRNWYIIVGVLVVVLLYALKNTSYFVRVSGFLASVLAFYLADLLFKFDFKNYHYLIFIFISAAGIMLSPLYFIIPTYDKVLHLATPAFLAILIFFLADRAKIKFSTKLVITFSVVIMFLALFEIGEFFLDQLFDMKLQGVFLRDYSGIAKLKIIQDRNDDTMIDLILGVIGTLVFVIAKLITFKIYKNKKK